MKQDSHKVIVIGGGIAGLCAAVYAQKCGYQTEILEMHDTAGGLATSWRRGDYTFETCLHWLPGSNLSGEWYSRWLEIFDIDQLKFIYPEEFVRLETEHGQSLRIYSSIDRLETELLKRTPQDKVQIRHFAADIRSLCKLKMPDPTEGWAANWLTWLRDIPYLPLLREISRMSRREYGTRFTDPLVRSFFGEGDLGQMSAGALFFSLAWMNQGDGGYPIGGSQAIIRQITEKLTSLGGRLRLGAKVERVLVAHDVRNDAAVGVRLVGGEDIMADWVISAADGRATIYDLLGGQYIDKATNKIYAELETFPSYLQVSLGIARDLSQQPGYVTRLLDSPLQVDPDTELPKVSFRFFHFDPTFAPAGKTAVTCFLPTRNFEYWTQLQQHDPAAYQAEKHRIAEAVIAILERRVIDVRRAIEVIDVSTPATVIRYTGNWKGSMEGWLLTPGSGYKLLPNTLPRLRHFLMVGQWVLPGGGLPSGLMTARAAIKAMCGRDRIPFVRTTAMVAA
jgi:phytoene dehydrogenase-like protein